MLVQDSGAILDSYRIRVEGTSREIVESNMMKEIRKNIVSGKTWIRMMPHVAVIEDRFVGTARLAMVAE